MDVAHEFVSEISTPFKKKLGSNIFSAESEAYKHMWKIWTA